MCELENSMVINLYDNNPWELNDEEYYEDEMNYQNDLLNQQSTEDI